MKYQQQRVWLIAVLVTISLVGLLLAQRIVADRSIQQPERANGGLYAEHVEDDFYRTLRHWQ